MKLPADIKGRGCSSVDSCQGEACKAFAHKRLAIRRHFPSAITMSTALVYRVFGVAPHIKYIDEMHRKCISEDLGERSPDSRHI
jgi:hypothetical protein